MARLTRAQSREINRRRVLEVAREVFAEIGYTAARVDDIADRVGFTRGVVYSNFASKRALYLAVLADVAEQTPVAAGDARSPGAALAALSRVWLGSPVLLLTVTGLAEEIVREPGWSAVFVRLIRLPVVLLSATLHELDTETKNSADWQAWRWRAAADLAVTMMTGHAVCRALDPDHVADAAAMACLADLDDVPAPSLPRYRPGSLRRKRADSQWFPPDAGRDLVRARAARVDRDATLAIVGLNRLAADSLVPILHPPRRTPVTLVLSTRDRELAQLARWPYRCCRSSSTPTARSPPLSGVVADDVTEAVIDLSAGRTTSRTSGRGDRRRLRSLPTNRNVRLDNAHGGTEMTPRTLTAAALLAAAATTGTAGLGHAQPILDAPGSAASAHGPDQGIGYTVTATPGGVVARLNGGRFIPGPDAASVAVIDAAGGAVAAIPLGLPTPAGVAVVEARIGGDGRTLALIPHTADLAAAQPIDEAADTVARRQHNAVVGALIGGGIGAVLGFFLGGVGALVTVPVGAGIGALIGYATP